jgi:hypothetical protein
MWTRYVHIKPFIFWFIVGAAIFLACAAIIAVMAYGPLA